MDRRVMERRVVVTGLGAVTPLGNDVDTFWRAVRGGECGVDHVTSFDVSDYPSKVAGEVRDLDPSKYVDRREARRMDRFAMFAMVTAMEALADAGLAVDDLDSDRTGVILGVGFGGIHTLHAEFKHLFDRGPKAVHPLLVPKMISNIAAGHVAIRIHAHGPSYTVVSACASANDAIGESYRWVKDGTVDVMVTGGAEAAVAPLAMSGFSVLQAVTSSYNDDPKRASRPFDKDRDGFVLGEGSGTLILEDLEHAKARSAPIYCEVVGYGVTCDANHLTAPHPRGKGAVNAMKMAIAGSGLPPEAFDYVNAHGTSTQLNDATETMAIKEVFGEHAARLKVSSTKSMVGHLLGAAGGVEAIATAKGLQEQFYPATINYETPDPKCDLDYVPNCGQDAPMRAALTNSFGFGGHNAVVALKRYDG